MVLVFVSQRSYQAKALFLLHDLAFKFKYKSGSNIYQEWTHKEGRECNFSFIPDVNKLNTHE